MAFSSRRSTASMAILVPGSQPLGYKQQIWLAYLGQIQMKSQG
jgi:hypothetical protein